MDEITIGARLRTLRRWRGMTQAELAGLADLSPSFLSMVEHGQRPLDRRSHIAALANALRVSETDLVSRPHLSADREQSNPHAAIPALRVALQTNSLSTPAVEHARPLNELVSEVQRTEVLRRACNYIAVGSLLPSIIDELHVHVCDPQDDAAQQAALHALIEACLSATFTAKNLGYLDLAHLAAVRADEAASLLADPLARGKSAYLLVQTLPREGSWDRTLRAAERAADALEPHTSSSLVAVQVLGLLTLMASLSAAAVLQGQKAEHWLREADRLADRVPDDLANWQSFSKTNVQIWRIHVGVELGQSGGAMLELASHVDRAKLTSPTRYVGFLSDVGRGLAREPKMRGEAVQWLREAEEMAPQRIRNSNSSRETVAYLLNRATATAGGRELRGMAARMGVPH
jgi:transcriptional regulator with XRE-family HTH domain